MKRLAHARFRGIMLRRFEYSILSCQQGKATWLDGKWCGSLSPADDPQRALASCPDELEQLNRMGANGWQVVAAQVLPVSGDHPALLKYVLMRTG